MSIRDFIEQADLNHTERETIKKAYGIDRNNRQYTATEVAVGLHVPVEAVRTGEAVGLAKLKKNTDIVEWFDSKMEKEELTSLEKLLLDALEKTNVEEYCVSEGWIRVAAGKALDRKGKPLTIKLKGPVEPYFRDPKPE